MLLSWTLTCLVALGIATVALIALGNRVHVGSRLVALVVVLAEVLASGQITADIWHLPSSYIIQAEILLTAGGVIVILLRPAWNPLGDLFMGCFVASAVAYLAFAGSLTFGRGLSWLGVVASVALLLLEIAALVISTYYTFESLDVTTRARTTRPPAPFDPTFEPRVSLQVAAYNEPPDMLIETIQSLEAVAYRNLEIVIIDNNTQDTETWRPVEEYCRDRPRVRFIHVEGVEGFKAGALNLTLREFTDPGAELIGIVDADYLVDPAYLQQTVGYFVDANLAFLQTPQDYREYQGDAYLTACYDAYRYFFATSMPSRNERNSIIFAGTMGLIRRSALEQLEGWDEWCITEDAEASLRLLKAGHSGLYLHQSFGQGIMPLTFSSLKSQRFRWCFGGIQILRKHYRELLPWRRDPDNHLTVSQRLDYLFGGVQWFTDVLYLGFTLVLGVSGLLLVATGHIGLQPLLGAAVLLPATLIASGMLRALWALRTSAGIGLRRSLLAFANWLSMSWTVSRACLAGLVKSEGVFLRTPKWHGERGLGEALRAARPEAAIAAFLWTLGILTITLRHAGVFLGFLFLWQGGVYASAPYMAWLNTRTRLSAPLERRRRSEERRERLRALAPYVTGISALAMTGTAAAAVFLAGGLSSGTAPARPVIIPHRAATDRGPVATLVHFPQAVPSLLPGVTTSPSPDTTPTPTDPGTSPSLSPGAVVPAPSPSPSPSPAAAPATSPAGAPAASPVAAPTAAAPLP